MYFVIKRFTSAAGTQSKQQQENKPQRQGRQGNHWRRSCHFTFRSGIPLLSLIFLIGTMQGSLAEEGAEEKTVSDMDRLRMELFINYDKNSQPMYRGAPTNITVGMSVNYVDIDELNGKMTMHSWINVYWFDEKRSWDKDEYNNITQIHLKAKEVWKPDITLFNSAGDEYIGDTQILLSNNGGFIWVPPVIYTTYCSLNLRMWPYDVQTCSVKIGSWTLSSIDLHRNLDFSELVQSTEWEIMDGTTSFHQRDYYNYIQYTLILQRRSTMYTAVIFTPASCIVLLALSTFWLPPQMGEKILLNCIIIVVIAAFLMYFAQLLPILAQNTPLVVLFYSSCLLLLSFSTIISVFVLYLSTAKHKKRLPDFIRNVLNGLFGRILLLSQFELEAEPQSHLNNSTKELGEHVYETADSESIGDHVNINPTPTNRSVQFDWILLATAVDRIAFLGYCLIFSALAIAYSV